MQTSAPDRQRIVLACGLLAILSFALHARVLGFGFVEFDDTTVLLAHPALYDETSFAASLKQIFVEAFPREEPLLIRDVSWALDARLFGFRNPFGYHLGNLLLNAANVVLLFVFLGRATGRWTFAGTTALLFSLLPVHVEPVAWVMGRKDLLSAFFLLAALVVQTFELAQTKAVRRRALYLATLLLTCLALLSKIAAMTAFVVLALHRILRDELAGPRAADGPFTWRRAVRTVVPSLLPHACASLAIVAWYQRRVAEFGVTGWRGSEPLDPAHLERVATFVPLVIGRYLRSIFLPGDLSAYHRWPHVEIALTPFELSAAFGLALVLLAGTLFACLRRRDLAFFVLSFLALLFPYFGFVFVDLWSADRYVYLASFAVVALAVEAGLALHAAGSPVRRAACLATLGLFALFSGSKTWQQQPAWRDAHSLWTHEASLAEPSLLALHAVARIEVDAAERSRSPQERARHIAAAHAGIERAFARDRALGRQPTGYATSEALQLARLHSLLGRLAGLEGAPLEKQIEHHLAAHASAPNRASAYRLAELHLALANRASGSERDRLVRRSLAYFVEYVEKSSRDPETLARNLSLLTRYYEEPHPGLRGEILAARRTLAR